MSARIAHAELLAFARAALRAAGACEAQARAVAEVLVWSDLAGRASQGVWRLPILVERLKQGGIRGDARPRFEPRAPGVGVVHGAGGAGHHVATVAMAHAIALARANGTGAVTAVDSNYFGAAAYYVNQAAAAGMIGIAASNSFPKVLAHGGGRAALGTNPLAFGAPRASGEALLVDAATSAAAGSTVRKNLEGGARLGEGLAVDAAGKPTRDPQSAGALLPLGGAKGYALAVMVELLCGVLAGPGFGAGVRSMYGEPARPGENGHLFLVLDIARFLPLAAYYERIEALAAWLESTGEPGAVRLPGAARWRALAENRSLGIPLDAPTVAALHKLAAELDVPLPSGVRDFSLSPEPVP